MPISNKNIMKINYPNNIFKLLSYFFQIIVSGLIIYYFNYILSDEQRQTLYHWNDPLLTILFLFLLITLIIINIKLFLNIISDYVAWFEKEKDTLNKDEKDFFETIFNILRNRGVKTEDACEIANEHILLTRNVPADLDMFIENKIIEIKNT